MGRWYIFKIHKKGEDIIRGDVDKEFGENVNAHLDNNYFAIRVVNLIALAKAVYMLVGNLFMPGIFPLFSNFIGVLLSCLMARQQQIGQFRTWPGIFGQKSGGWKT